VSAAGTPAPPAPASTDLAPAAAPVISNNGGSLQGLVRAPLAVVQASGLARVEGGVAIISDNGGGLVGKAKYALHAAPAELPLAGATVRLLDPAGRPLNDTAGKPLTAVTGPDGRYTFAEALPTGSYVAVADLGPAGRLAGTITPGGKQADLDLNSSLTTGYILEKYLKGQADPQAALDRLPAEVEADTRAKAATALAEGRVAIPETLTPERVVATVESLRKGNSAFDAQLETVKRILIVAGQSDLGNGRPGREVSLSSAFNPVVAPDGSLYFADALGNGESLIRRLKPDGVLETVAGNPFAFGGPPLTFGRVLPAGEVVLVSPRPAFDARGRLLVEVDGGGRILRLEGDGNVRVVYAPEDSLSYRVFGVAGATGDELWVVHALPGTGDSMRGTFKVEDVLVALGADGKEREIARFDDAATKFQVAPGRIGSGSAGLMWTAPPEGGAIAKLDLATGAFTPTGETGWIDGAGNVFTLSGTRLQARSFGGRGFAFELGAGQTPAPGGTALAPDGTLYLIDGGKRVLRLRDGTSERVAGLEAGSAPGGGTVASALVSPQGAVIGPDGALYVVEQDAGEILRIENGVSSRYARGLASPRRIAGFAGGDLLVLEAGKDEPQLARVPAAEPRTPEHPLANGLGSRLYPDAATLPDGSTYICAGQQLYRLVAGRLDPIDLKGDAAIALAVDAGGTLWTYGYRLTDTLDATHTLGRYTPGTGYSRVARLAESVMRGAVHALAVDARGRAYMAIDGGFDLAPIMRFDPPSYTGEAVIGPGTAILGGTGVDDGLHTVHGLSFDDSGNLYLTDSHYKQVKRIGAEQLP
jgi:streptogramin lyase